MTCKLPSGCKNNVYGKLKFCALHCSEKDIDDNKYHDYLMEFYKLFSKYLHGEVEVEINRQRCENKYELDERDNDIEEYHLFIGGVKPEGVSHSLIERLGKINIEFKKIQFPDDDDISYLEGEAHALLRWIGKVLFNKCIFNLGSLNLNSNFYYEDCVFCNEISINPFPEVEDNDYRYIDCLFRKNIYIKPSKQSKKIFCNLFKDCNFEEDINLNNIDFKKTVFHLSHPLDNVSINNIKERFNKVKSNFKFKNIKIEKCNFDSSFKLNGFGEKYLEKLKCYKCEFDKDWLEISSLEIIDTEFNSKFELKNRVIKNLDFNNSNVSKIFDMYESKIEKAHFKKNIFYDFAGFENVVFGIKNKPINTYVAKFEYTTFESFSNFRNTIFYSGLDFKNTNRDKEPNFLNSYINSENTDRETFRIVKHSFDDVGNKIEANKFYSKEMNAYRREMKGKFKPSERFVFCMNNFISEFGTSYLKPILLLIILFEVYIILLSYYGGAYSLYGTIVQLDMLNNLAKDFLLFSRFLKVGFEFVSLIFYIFSGILIWQIAVAIKRHTQR